MSDGMRTVDLVGRLAKHIDLNDEATFYPTPEPAFADIPAAVKPEPEPTPERADVAARIATAVPPPRTPNPPSAPLIELDFRSLQDKGFLTPTGYNPVLAEEYRIIKRPLLRAAFHPEGYQNGWLAHTALITSPHPNDGKTFTAINLGISMAAEHDVHVLLVDGDSRQRGLSRALGIADRQGLMDVLIDPSISLGDVIVRTSIPNLSAVPAGRSVEGPTELLAGPRMRELVNEMTRRYSDRFILIDAPPVLSSSEPGVLAGYVGQVVMVVQANETTKEAISESLSLVDACSNVNFILNKVTLSAGPNRFGYSGFYEDG
jgi:exopolysaccharide/PEP-CTERM locus tyrosine autokinase